jgi:hypothetical protein
MRKGFGTQRQSLPPLIHILGSNSGVRRYAELATSLRLYERQPSSRSRAKSKTLKLLGRKHYVYTC